MTHLIVDAHEDLAYNILNFHRDYTLSAAEIRAQEQANQSVAIKATGEALLGWEDYQRGSVALVFPTLFAMPLRRKLGEWDTQVYADSSRAHAICSAQLDAYHRLVDDHPDKFTLISSRADLDSLLAHWSSPAEANHPVGLLPLMEGAEGVRSPSELSEWWQRGVRLIGPAWGATRFCGGSGEPGPLTEEGRQLLAAMAEIGFALDLSHMDMLAVRQSLDAYPGTLLVSHANASVLIRSYTGNRHIPDDLIRAIVQRDGVIGVIPFCRFLDYEWRAGDPRQGITLETLAAHIDHICQLAGDSAHVGLGTDFDGGFGLSAAPAQVQSIADLQSLEGILAARGYNDAQVSAVLGGNWLRLARTFLP
jgi:membrane dipeptidase